MSSYQDYEIDSHLNDLLDFCQEFEWLINGHGVRFFTNKIESFFPPDWLEYLTSFSDSQLYLLPCVLDDIGHEKTSVDAPESLLLFLKKCKKFSLQNFQFSSQELQSCLKINNDHIEKIPKINESRLYTILTRAMSPKKRHEVERLAHLIYLTSIASKTKTIVDLGSGQGYLLQILSFYYNLDVIGFDSSEIQTKGAFKRAQKLQKDLKMSFFSDPSLSTQINLRPLFLSILFPITCDIKIDQIVDCVDLELKNLKSCTENSQSNNLKQIDDSKETKTIKKTTKYTKNEKFPFDPFKIPDTNPLKDENGVLLVGLHTCGDLASSMIKLFKESKNIKAMINIGCCYNLMTDSNFPLSKKVKTKIEKLGRTARVLACQSISRRSRHVCNDHDSILDENENENLDEKNEENLAFDVVHKSQIFRAVLQVIYEEYYDIKYNFYSGPISASYMNSFSQYAEFVLKKQKLEQKLTKQQLEEIYQKYEPHQRKLIAYDNLRNCMAPIIETLILIDRMEMLKSSESSELNELNELNEEQNNQFKNQQNHQNHQPNQNLQNYLIPIFDPVASPRNFAIISIKK